MNEEKQVMEHDYEEISIKELIETLWGYKWLILVLTILSGLIAFMAGQVMSARSEQVQTVVSLEWNGLVDGTYPDGERFIYNNMFESYVLSDALADAGVDTLTTTDLRSALEIVPIIPSDVVSMIERSIEQGERITYYATEYKLMLETGDLDIDNEQGKMLLEYLIEAFKVDFEHKYIGKALVFNYTDTDLSKYDYSEMVDVLELQVSLLNSVLETALEDGSNFRSTSLGLGFDDLVSRLSLVKEVELNNIDARVSNYLLTKDLDLVVTRHEFMVEELSLEIEKLLMYEGALEENILDYTGQETIVIIPGLDSEYSVDPYINTLYNELIDTQEQLSNAQADKSYYQNKIDEMVILYNTTYNDGVTYERQVALVENSLEDARASIGDVATDLDTMLEEYNRYITRNTVLPLTAPQVTSDVNVLLYTAIGTVLGGMVSLLVVFLRETLKKD